MNNNIFNIIQWNPNGFYSKIDEIKLIINRFSPVALCIQETNFIDNKSGSLKNYVNFFKNRTNHIRASGGVATFINTQYPSEEITLVTNLEAVAVKISVKYKLTICNFYTDIQNIIDQLPTPFIILGDFNSHNILWGCNDTDQRGRIIEKILDNNNSINILNNGQATRISTSTGNLSAIDLSLSSATISPHLEWNTMPELSSSDHFPIKLTLKYTNPDEKHSRSLKWRLKNANWDTYQIEIEKNIINHSLSFSNNNDVEDTMEELSNLIYNTASNIFEQNSYSGKRPPVPWWNKTIKHAIRNKKTTFNKFKRTNDFNDFIEFKKYKALVRKSCGSDKIPFIFLQTLPSSGKFLLLRIIPIKWKNAIITPIPKNNQNSFKPTGYRPISVLCSMSKLLEKIIYNRLSWYATHHKLLSPCHHGFRKYHSTTDCHVKIETEVIETFANKQSMILISLDLQKAYDTVWRHRVINLLKNWNIHGNMLIFLTNFLSQRSFQVKIRDQRSNTFILENGVPQGSPLSIFLFQTAINNLPSIITNPAKSFIFADDTYIYIRGTQISAMIGTLQKCLNDLFEWCFKAGFIFSPQKTKCILFSNKRKLTKPKLFLGTSRLPFVEDISILGLTFDKKLSWKSHIMSLKKNSYKSLNVIKSLSHCEWGAEGTILLNVYRSLVRSKLDYGSICYGNSKSKLLNIVDTIHNAGLRCSIGAFKSSPIVSLLSLTGEPPLQYRRTILSLNYIDRILSSPENSTIHFLNKKHFSNIYEYNPKLRRPLGLRLLKEMMDINIEYNEICQRESSLIPTWQQPNYLVDTSLKEHLKKETPNTIYNNLFNELIHTSNTSTQIYTDASKTEMGIGLAVVHLNTTKQYKLNKLSSIYSAEYLALLKGVQLALDINSTKIDICSDSLSALTNLQSKTLSEPLAVSISNLLSKSNKEIRFIWTPGHCNIKGNEKADEADRNSVNSPDSEIIPFSSLVDIRRNINKYCIDLWNSQWHTTTENKLREIKHSVVLWLKYTDINRKNEVILNRLRIGHTKLTHGHLMAKTDPPLCPTCNTNYSIKHIITQCPNFNEARKDFNIPDNLYEAIRSFSNFYSEHI
ncbi:hypothetical protein AGLY_012460 [Aphis glycines]|uniref:RNA-directed DNA polymerase n=1 Tax=Aphis glycines TaxID=307491 RepID=A0A6G0TAS1_APHGL|nr:hypothetical protein AGLY_012460 [Aphis glycines]